MNQKIFFGEKTLVMGIINTTWDSFYPGSRVHDRDKAIERALSYEKLGADIVDIGGESTRPGSKPVEVDEELERVIPVIQGIREQSNILVSIDTYKPEVAKRAIEHGANIVNDISGLRYDNGLEHVVAEAGVYIIIMHIRGMPEQMQSFASYDDVCDEVSKELDVSIEKALSAGIRREKIIIDPGIGFAKQPEHNLRILKNLSLFKRKGYPLLIGLSRKSFLGAYTGLEVEDRLIPTVAANAITIFQGADIIRVHDVKEALLTVTIADLLKPESTFQYQRGTDN